MINRRKGFTLAETLITITAIAVLAAITLPILNKAKADEDTVVYRKGMYTIQRAMQKFMESSEYERLLQSTPNVNESDCLANFTWEQVCNALAKEINTKGKIKCNKKSVYSISRDPAFITTDGIAFFMVKAPSDKIVKVDTNDPKAQHLNWMLIDNVKMPSKGIQEKRKAGRGLAGGMRVYFNHKGKFYLPQRTGTQYEQSLLQDFTKMKN